MTALTKKGGIFLTASVANAVLGMTLSSSSSRQPFWKILSILAYFVLFSIKSKIENEFEKKIERRLNIKLKLRLKLRLKMRLKKRLKIRLKIR